jgi:hypothetical protein
MKLQWMLSKYKSALYVEITIDRSALSEYLCWFTDKIRIIKALAGKFVAFTILYILFCTDFKNNYVFWNESMKE